MSEGRSIQFHPIFDFSEFLKKGIITDCEIRDQENFVIKAHKVILANSSLYFQNIFTANMEEQTSGIVEIDFNPNNLLETVINYMYVPIIEITETNWIDLYAIASKYQIKTLEQLIIEKCESFLSISNIYTLIDNFFDNPQNEYRSVAEALIPFIISNFDKISLDDLLPKLTVSLFSLILKGLSKSIEEKIKLKNKFLGDYNPDEVEKKLLDDAINFK